MEQTSLTPFVAGLRRVFDVAFQMNVRTTATLDAEPAGAAPRDVRASVELRGDVDATVVLEFSYSTAQRLVALLSGIDVHNQSGEAIRDGIGEIANMVAGNAKAHLGGLEVRSAPPRVSIDEACPASLTRSALSVGCLSDCGDFVLRLVPATPRATVTMRALREVISR